MYTNKNHLRVFIYLFIFMPSSTGFYHLKIKYNKYNTQRKNKMIKLNKYKNKEQQTKQNKIKFPTSVGTHQMKIINNIIVLNLKFLFAESSIIFIN